MNNCKCPDRRDAVSCAIKQGIPGVAGSFGDGACECKCHAAYDLKKEALQAAREFYFTGTDMTEHDLANTGMVKFEAFQFGYIKGVERGQ